MAVALPVPDTGWGDEGVPEFRLVAKGCVTGCTFRPGHLGSRRPTARDPASHIPLCQWAYTPTAAASEPASYMLVSPAFGVAPREYATLLTRHMEYHAGFDLRYLVYVEECGGALAADARLQVGGRL